MSVEKLSAGVVGVGIMGQNHVRAYSEHPLVDVTAIIDIDTAKATTIAEEYGADATYTDVGTAIDERGLDIVSIATPESIHLAPTRQALERNCHVLLEKPISETVTDATAIGDLVSQSEASLMLGYVCRFDPRYAGLQDRIESGEFGSILGVQAARIAPREMYDAVADWTNAIYYMAVHDIDMLRWYVDSEITRVYSEASGGLNGTETPAVIKSTLRFENGAVGTLETNWARPESYPADLTEEIRVSGTEAYGRLVIENDDAGVAADDGYEFVDTSTVHGKQAGNISREVSQFVESVISGSEPLVDWEDGLRSLEVANAVLESIDEGEPILV